MRVRRSFQRPEGKKTARLIVVASEGKDTERIYFEAVKEHWCAVNVHLEILRRDNNNSGPENVVSQLLEFKDEYDLDDEDSLWLVIDRDKWKEATLAAIAQRCVKDKYLHMAMSNPCFELWLLLHFEDVDSMNDALRQLIRENRHVNKSGDTFLKKRIRGFLGSYHESKYDAAQLMPYLDIARNRAERLDIDKQQRWPQDLGSHVYRLIDNIMNK